MIDLMSHSTRAQPGYNSYQLGGGAVSSFLSKNDTSENGEGEKFHVQLYCCNSRPTWRNLISPRLQFSLASRKNRIKMKILFSTKLETEKQPMRI